MSPLRKQAIFTKRVILDEIFIFRDSVMLEYQLIEKGENIAKRNFFGFECFRSGLKNGFVHLLQLEKPRPLLSAMPVLGGIK